MSEIKPKNELVENWNKLVAFKIRENNLLQPDSQFLCSALESFLLNINFDCVKVKNALLNDPDRNRKYRIQLCRYIDQLYKLSDKTNLFCYYDLVNPLPRKTTHLLNVLFNYYLYYKMVKDYIVLSKANATINGYYDILEKTNAIQAKNDEDKIRAGNVKQKMVELNNQIPIILHKIAELTDTKQCLRTEIQQVGAQTKIQKSDILAISVDVKKLETFIVKESEVNNLMLTANSINKKLVELDEMEKETYKQETTVKINEAKLIIEQINLILSRFHRDDMLSSKTTFDLLKSLKFELIQLKITNKEFAIKIDTMLAKVNQLKKIIETKSAAAKQMEADYNLKEQQQNDQQFQLIKNNESLTKDVQDKLENVAELQSVQKFITSAGQKLVRKIINPEANIDDL